MADYPSSPSAEPSGAALLTGVVKTLPLLPESTHALLVLNVRDSNLPEKVQAIVEKEPALAAYVIRLANSVVFSGSAEVKTIRAAIHRVGPAMLLGTVLQRAINGIFDAAGGMTRRLGQISVFEANVMLALATVLEPRLQVAPDLAYTQGLLHDIGHLVMALKLGGAFESFGHRDLAPDEVAQIERATFGFDHQQAGRLLANHWKFPEEITMVIASHHFPAELRHGGPDSINSTIEMLAVADRVSRIIGEGAERRRRGTAAVAAWLGSPEGRSLVQTLGATQDEVLRAVPLALASLDLEERMAAAA
jgi:HD-like signal output (HDOD) protein